MKYLYSKEPHHLQSNEQLIEYLYLLTNNISRPYTFMPVLTLKNHGHFGDILLKTYHLESTWWRNVGWSKAATEHWKENAN